MSDDGYEIAAESPFARLDDDETRAWYAYMKVHLRIRYEMNRQLRDDSGISLADYDVLVALVSDERGTLTVTDLATRIGGERSRLSHHVKRMAARGLVELGVSETDRRASTVMLTTDGRATLAAAAPAHVDFVRRAFLSALDADELAGFAGSLERVYERLLEHGTLPRPVDHP
ncbi:MarR family winged helix-turn-helix transcriptional regulator [Herbiconiux sp. A18JL235]|uniref:MarR family winged helix-turn-helix transcriptional regulator n=1 Tax=Herbiconiux sp. A18JL235 TaxID=3152363 RepID=A0AB39BD85_9MICO